jgi:hypothetical protein
VAVRLDEIVARFGGEIVGAGDTAISRISTLESAGPGELAFLANPKYRHQLATTRACRRDHGAAGTVPGFGGCDPDGAALPLLRARRRNG